MGSAGAAIGGATFGSAPVVAAGGGGASGSMVTCESAPRVSAAAPTASAHRRGRAVDSCSANPKTRVPCAANPRLHLTNFRPLKLTRSVPDDLGCRFVEAHRPQAARSWRWFQRVAPQPGSCVNPHATPRVQLPAPQTIFVCPVLTVLCPAADLRPCPKSRGSSLLKAPKCRLEGRSPGSHVRVRHGL
eukprot:COSAG06_NODE_19346_length_842_cov_4.890983_1_plen_188_part_00